MTPSLIALTGLASSGKSTIADFLVHEHKFTKIKFAAPLKRMLSALGLTWQELEGEFKELPCAMLQGHTPREAMQWLGTEWGREKFGENFWVDIWKGFVKSELSHGGRVVVDDCRFLSEAAAVRALGGHIWRVMRPGLEPGMHQSETELGRISFDIRFSNDAGIKDLRDLVRGVMAK